MPYVSCPSCRLKLNGRYAYTMESCPRCLAKTGTRVPLEAHLGDPKQQGRFVETVRDELASRGGLSRRQSAASSG